MKIADVKTYVLGYAYDKPWGSARVWFERATQLLVEVRTDDGIVGWGTAGSKSEIPVIRTAIDAVLAANVVGRDPFDSEALWNEMYHKVKDGGTKGIMISAISALDMAIWDIKGKAVGRPIYELLGGKLRDRVPAYATGFYFTSDPDQTQVAVDNAIAYREQGFRAMKVKLGLGVAQDVERVKKVREVVGPDVLLMTDASRAYDVSRAVRLGHQLEEYDVGWFEEPISPEDLDGYAELCRALDVPIAGGEGEATKYAFRDIIAKRAFDLIQPSVARCGGFTEAKKIAAIAEAWGVRYQPHTGFSPLDLAAGLQMLAIVPDSPMSMHTPPPLLEIINVQNPLRDELPTTPIQLEDGWVTIPTGPGLGIEIDRAVVEQYRID